MTNIELLEDLFRDIEYITRLDYVDPILRGEARDHLNEIYHKQNKNLKKIEKELKAFEIFKKYLTINFGQKVFGDNSVIIREKIPSIDVYLAIFVKEEEKNILNEVLNDNE